MIVTEQLDSGRVRQFSDAGRMLRQRESGALYVDAVDVLPLRYTYEETDEPVPDEEAGAADYEAALSRLGVET